ncbi:MAG: right-handed parallel beta-helix repeat-containing protein [Prevotella sp.]|nr:right-handed parallel beta-helix repeat-containing protein [Prevotella sp.]
MKKIFSGFMMAAAALFVTSCASDELTSSQTGGEATVSFSLALEDGIGTRAISDGSGADVLEYAVFNEKGERVSGIQKVKRTGVTFPTVENITLAKGQTYKIAFWAQDEDCKAYTVSDDMNVSIDYVGVNNDETRDAFFKSIEFTVSGSASLDVVLKRPFAQINVGVYQEDWDAAVASGIEIANSVAYIKNAATSINLLNGMVGEETTDVPVEYTAAAIPTESLMVDVDKDGTKEAYKWLSMSYILVADHGTTPNNDGIYGAAATTLNDLGFSFVPVSGNAITFAQGLKSVPVERNWRTNIIGKILTGDVEFNISIDPIYDGDYIYPDGAMQELAAVLAMGGVFNATGPIEMEGEQLRAQADAILNFNGNKVVAGSAADYGIVAYGEGVDLVINDADIDSKGGGVGAVNGANVVFNGDKLAVNSGSTSGRYLFYLEGAGSTITINEGEFSFSSTLNQKRAYIYAGAGTTAYVKGGTFGKASTRSGYTAGILGEGTVIITGGTFGFDPSAWVAPGYKVVKNGDKYYVVAENVSAVASTQDEINAAVAAGGTVVVAAGEYTFPGSSIKEGTTLACEEGTVFKGQSSLNIKGATVEGATFDNPGGTVVGGTINGTFKNCKFTGSNALRWASAGETVVFEDCEFSGDVYGVHFDGGANDVIFRNCVLSGFNALGAALTMATFEGCTFKGNGKSGYNGANLWGSAKMINCEFTFDGSTANEWIDCIGLDKTYEFENCTVNGVAYTKDNYTTAPNDNIFSRNHHPSIKINGVACAF